MAKSLQHLNEGGEDVRAGIIRGRGAGKGVG